MLSSTQTDNMKNKGKTKEQLINESEELRERTFQLEESESRHLQTCEKLPDGRELYRSILEASPN